MLRGHAVRLCVVSSSQLTPHSISVGPSARDNRSWLDTHSSGHEHCSVRLDTTTGLHIMSVPSVCLPLSDQFYVYVSPPLKISPCRHVLPLSAGAAFKWTVWGQVIIQMQSILSVSTHTHTHPCLCFPAASRARRGLCVCLPLTHSCILFSFVLPPSLPPSLSPFSQFSSLPKSAFAEPALGSGEPKCVCVCECLSMGRRVAGKNILLEPGVGVNE